MTAGAILSLRSVRVRFGGLTALDVDELAIPGTPGVTALFLGPNGAGKTTLLNAITGYATVDRGACITLHVGESGIELRGLDRDRIVHAGVARTFQTPLFFASLAVREAMLVAARFGAGPSWRDRLTSLVTSPDARVADVCRVEAIIDALGLSAVANRPLRDLPLSLLRRAELGRCLAGQPRVLMMLDEPTAGADDEERLDLARFLHHRLPRLIDHLCGNGLYRFPCVTVGIVTHDMRLLGHIAPDAPVAMRAHVLHRGRLFASGTLGEVMADPRVQDIYFGTSAA